MPALLIFALGGRPLLSAVFGEELTDAAGSLPWLGAAMTFLACTYLAVQYLLALGRSGFVAILVCAAAVEVALLARIGADLEALALFALQLACAAAVLTLAFNTQVDPASERGKAQTR